MDENQNDCRWVRCPICGGKTRIFDHVFAVVPMFDLKIYQKPSSNTLESINNSENIEVIL